MYERSLKWSRHHQKFPDELQTAINKLYEQMHMIDIEDDYHEGMVDGLIIAIRIIKESAD